MSDWADKLVTEMDGCITVGCDHCKEMADLIRERCILRERLERMWEHYSGNPGADSVVALILEGSLHDAKGTEGEVP